MKGVFNTLNIILFSLFMAGIVLVLFAIFSLPEALERASIKIDQGVMGQVMPVLYWRFAVIIATITTGIGTLLVTLRQVDRQHRAMEIGPVEGSTAADREEGASTETAKDLSGTLESIEQAVASERQAEKKVSKWLSAVCSELQAGQAALYLRTDEDLYEFHSGYAFDVSNREQTRFAAGDGLVGQVAKSGRMMQITDVPPDYMKVFSGLGSGDPASLLIIPFQEDGQVIAVAEFASFSDMDHQDTAWIASSFQQLRSAYPVKHAGSDKKSGKARRKSNTVASK